MVKSKKPTTNNNNSWGTYGFTTVSCGLWCCVPSRCGCVCVILVCLWGSEGDGHALLLGIDAAAWTLRMQSVLVEQAGTGSGCGMLHQLCQWLMLKWGLMQCEGCGCGAGRALTPAVADDFTYSRRTRDTCDLSKAHKLSPPTVVFCGADGCLLVLDKHTCGSSRTQCMNELGWRLC